MTCIDLIIYIVSVTFLTLSLIFFVDVVCFITQCVFPSYSLARHAPSVKSGASTRTKQATLPSRFQSFPSTSTAWGQHQSDERKVGLGGQTPGVKMLSVFLKKKKILRQNRRASRFLEDKCEQNWLRRY